jgi:cyclase
MTGGNRIRSRAVYFVLFWSIAPVLFAQGNDRLLELTPTTYVRVASPNGNAVGNSGFIILEESVLVFDTHFTPEAGRELLKEIRAITPKPVRYVVNSHFHPDHTHGNQVFEGAFIIGSLRTRQNALQDDLPALNRTIRVTGTQLERMQKEAEREKLPEKLESIRQEIKTQEDYLANLRRLKISAPIMALDDYLSIREGPMEVVARVLGPGHTDGDTILIVPSERIVFCGDLFFNIAIPNVQDAYILPWMQTLRKILELDADVFVPGHGPPGKREDVVKFLGYFEDLRSLVEQFVLRGASAEQAMREIQIPEAYSRYRFKNFFQDNIQKMYDELKALHLEAIPIEGPQRPKDR